MADEQFEFAGLDDAVGVRVHDRAVRHRDLEGDGLGLAGFQCDALERLQFAVGPAVGGHDVADVGLHDLHAGALAGVGEGDFGTYGVGFGECAVGVACAARNGRFAVCERRVAQAFAERERRILGEVGVPVAVLAANLVVVDRQLARVAREGDRQSARRAGQAQDYFGDGLTAAHARVRRPQDGAGAGFRVADALGEHAVLPHDGGGQHLRLGADEHGDHRLAGFARDGGERVEQGVLATEQFERGGGAGFADQLDHVADHGHDQIGLASVGHGFVDHCLIDGGGNADFRARLAVRVELAGRVRHEVDDVRAARVDHFAIVGGELGQAVEHGGNHVSRLAIRHPGNLTGVAGPVAELVLGVVGKRAYHSDALGLVCGERQGAVVAQQGDGFAGEFQVGLLVFGGADDRLDAFGIRQARVFEQAEAEFQGQDAGYRIVNQGFVEQTGFYGFDGSLIELWGGHDQVVAGLDRIGCGVHVIGLDMLFPYRAADVVPVGDQRAIVLPCAAQLVGQQPFVERDRHAFDGLVAEHERAAAFFGHAFERRQEPGFELAVGEVGFGGVTAALGLGVTGEMLGAGQDRVLR